MQNLKERRPLLIKILAVVLLVLLCCNLPSLLFWPLCLKQDLFRPPNTEVLVSACKRPTVAGVPGGEALFVHELRTDKTYLLDLRTGEKRNVPNDPLMLDYGVFLTPELVWLEGSSSRPESPGYRPHYILDLTNGRRYELLDLDLLPRLEGGKFDPKYYAYLQSAEQVFIHHKGNTLIALFSDFRTNQNGGVIFSGYAIATEDGELLEKLTEALGVRYEIADFSLYYADVPSPTGRYVVSNDGIYLSGTNTLVVTPQYAGRRHNLKDYFRSWYYDESGVVVQGAGYDLIHIASWSSFYYIPSPVLKLRMPTP